MQLWRHSAAGWQVNEYMNSTAIGQQQKLSVVESEKCSNWKIARQLKILLGGDGRPNVSQVRREVRGGRRKGGGGMRGDGGDGGVYGQVNPTELVGNGGKRLSRCPSQLVAGH